jgi:hypothetical protein
MKNHDVVIHFGWYELGEGVYSHQNRRSDAIYTRKDGAWQHTTGPRHGVKVAQGLDASDLNMHLINFHKK